MDRGQKTSYLLAALILATLLLAVGTLTRCQLRRGWRHYHAEGRSSHKSHLCITTARFRLNTIAEGPSRAHLERRNGW